MIGLTTPVVKGRRERGLENGEESTMHYFYRGHTHDHRPNLEWAGAPPKPLTIGIGGPVGSGKTALCGLSV